MDGQKGSENLANLLSAELVDCQAVTFQALKCSWCKSTSRRVEFLTHRNCFGAKTATVKTHSIKPSTDSSSKLNLVSKLSWRRARRIKSACFG